MNIFYIVAIVLFLTACGEKPETPDPSPQAPQEEDQSPQSEGHSAPDPGVQQPPRSNNSARP